MQSLLNMEAFPPPSAASFLIFKPSLSQLFSFYNQWPLQPFTTMDTFRPSSSAFSFQPLCMPNLHHFLIILSPRRAGGITVEFFPPPSSDSTTSERKYDIFLNFRDEDTGYNFTSHLHSALNANKIPTFIYNDIENGEQISPSLSKAAIEESKISLVILSQDYASSERCLEELVKILECRRNNGQIVLPVFYQVDPSHVRNQTGGYKDIFAQHEESSLVKTDNVQSWKAALREVAHLSGWHLSGDRSEAEVIKEIMRFILKKLNKMAPIYYSKNLVGIESGIQKIKSLLSSESEDVRVVGIWGMGGLGKTTLARVIYDQFSSEFESSCFLSNTREQLQRSTLAELQEKLFSDLLGKERLNTNSALNLRFSFIKYQLSRIKVLLVVDDVDNSIYLQQLLLDSEGDLFGSGSRILITSRDKQVLKNIASKIYEMQELNKDEAIKLFSLNAFKQESPPSYYINQSTRVINYAKGNPLALTVLGCALFDRSAEDWESMLKRLGNNIPNNEIHNVLRSSYDALNAEEQRIFLDIACFFRGEGRDRLTKIWSGYYHSIQFSISILIDRCLIEVSSDNKLMMHDLLQEMGHNIVFSESERPENRSRLWKAEEISYVLKENKGTEVTECISFDMSEASNQIRIKGDAFLRMSSLRFLKFDNSSFDELYGKLQLSFDNLRCLPSELRYLHWKKFPMKSLPSNFIPENLVVLNLPHSNVKKLWIGIQNLVNLKELDLSRSIYLTRIPDFSKAVNMEKLNLSFCGSLKEVHPSIQHLNKLEFFDLIFCGKLRKIPGRFDSKVIKALSINFCPKLKEGCLDFEGKDQLKELMLDCRVIKDVESTISSIRISSTLCSLHLYNCGTLSSLPSSFYELTSLKQLSLENFSELESFPDILEPMSNIQEISLRNCINLKSLPDSICNMKSLWYLNLNGSAVKEIPSSIKHLHCLISLWLEDCRYLESLPSSIRRLPRLKVLRLNSCERLRSLPELPMSLETIDANNCKSLETVLISFFRNCNITELKFGNCLRLDLKALGLDAQYQIKRNENLSFKLTNDDPEFFLLYPGSEIPKWFDNPSTGSAITQQFPSNLEQFKAIAYCVVFESKKSIKDLSKYYFQSNVVVDGCALPEFWSPFTYTNILANTDHVAMWSLSLEGKKRTVSSFDLYVRKSDAQYKIDKHCKVKGCGVSLVGENSLLTKGTIAIPYASHMLHSSIGSGFLKMELK